ncbi:uncharacterized protein LOC111697130 isoform X2 [Eurytemora carolleeae]|uniref:uncharacterized protein LOC111697130 isoform X2 n=1 Tax=Eurytemora carolleeae TaxID=1294199 RepID=UPI000C776634|nr:uncharacterized protein LOC111697130 isoform X2 [Eurytemora carolleeae]|eukprot:XP_023322794.1 uncharacterized protein LOC111697130 isoform X2 [Eurytemora affinis]
MITVRSVTPEDYSGIILLLRKYFFPHEPAAVGLDLCPKGYAIPGVEKTVLSMLETEYSLVAEEDGQLIGVLVANLKTGEDDDSDEKKPEKDDSDELPEKMIKLLSFFDDLSTDFGRFCIMEKYCKTSCLEIYMLCTKSEVRKQGLATKLVSQALKMAEEKQVGLVETLALSVYSQAIFRKLGFQVENEIPYKDYAQDEVLIFDVRRMGEHKSGMYMCKLT